MAGFPAVGGGAPILATGRGARWRGGLERTDLLGRASIGLFVAVTVALICAPLLAPHGPTKSVGAQLAHPGRGHLLGLDQQGRDILSRVLFGMRTSWFSAFLVIAVAIVIGGLIGLAAGIAGGWLDAVLMRLTEVFLALPGTLIALAVAAALGAGLRNTLVAISVVWWPFYARIIRGEARALMARPHVEAARLGGCSWGGVALRHVLPGVLGSVLVVATLDIGNVLLVLAGLSFLGLGSPPPSPELGAMTAQGLQYLLGASWVPIWPAAAIFMLTLIGNLAGDGMRDVAGT